MPKDSRGGRAEAGIRETERAGTDEWARSLWADRGSGAVSVK